jgi:glycosyltransferase involved in cell wall biosynthesis
MRILHIGKYYPPARGGMERFLADLVDAQRAAGDEVAVLVHAHARGSVEDDPEWLMRCPVWIRLFFAPISLRFVFWLHRAIRRHRPDVLHIHMPNLSPFWALLLPSARRIPWVIQWQSDVEPSKFKLSLRLLYPHYRIFERALLERAESVIVASPQYLETSRPLEPWRHKCRVIPLGVSPERLPEIDPRESAGLWNGDGLRVLTAGRLTYYKGFDTLIEAAAGEPGIEVVIVGAGEEYGRLERVIGRTAALSRIRLAGEVDDPTLCRLMATCDVFCLPSKERTEAFGLVLLEAMRYGKPLLVSDLSGSGVTFVARDGQNAILVPPGDVDAWRAQLQSLARDPARGHMIGRLGHERYLREFQIDDVARAIDQEYRVLLAMSADDDAAAVRDEWGPLTSGAGEDGTAASSLAPQDRLLVVIPALNEAVCIGDVIAQARAHGGIDVLVVDDGSTDDTAAVALVKGATVLRAPLWQGAWGAIQTGIRYAVRKGYGAVVTMDADGQHEPAHLPQIIEAGRTADVVIAACASRGSRLRHIAWWYFRFLTGFGFEDLTSGFRYYNGSACRLLAADEATLLDYQDIGVLLLLRRANLRIAEIPVAMNPRRNGASRVFFSWWTVVRYMAETSLLCLARWNPGARRG